MTKRKCIFTGQESNFLAQLGDDKHNWAKRVPCTREWWEANKDRHLTPNEFKLVELFFEQEVALLKVDNIEAEMEKIRNEGVLTPAEEMTHNFKFVAEQLGIADKLYNKDFIVYDEPEDMNAETAKKIMEEPLKIPNNAEAKLLTTPKNDDNIKKTVVKKKKPTLWD